MHAAGEDDGEEAETVTPEMKPLTSTTAIMGGMSMPSFGSAPVNMSPVSTTYANNVYAQSVPSMPNLMHTTTPAVTISYVTPSVTVGQTGHDSDADQDSGDEGTLRSLTWYIYDIVSTC